MTFVIQKTKQQQEQIQKQQREQQVREMRGAKLFTDGHVFKINSVYYVQSATDLDIIYKVQYYKCECPDFERRQLPCKHIYAIRYYFCCNSK